MFRYLAEDEWIVEEAVNANRSAYLLNRGYYIQRNGKVTKPTNKIQGGADIVYEFVGGEKQQSASLQGKLFHSLISGETMSQFSLNLSE